MGKKRRYINRARKFAKKAFAFLDKLDGSAADGAIEEYDAFVKDGDWFIDTQSPNYWKQLIDKAKGDK